MFISQKVLPPRLFAYPIELYDMKRRKFLYALGISLPLAGCSESRDQADQLTTESSYEQVTENPSDQNNTTEEIDPTRTDVKVGEVFGEADLKAVIRDFSKKQKLNEYDEAGTGNDYAIIRLVVKNVSEEYDTDLDSFNPLFSATLKDNEGYVYDDSFLMTDTPFMDITLVPGGVMRGDKVYKVPDNAGDLKMQFDFSNEEIINLNEVNVDLTDETNNVADLTQDFKIQIHEIGDSVSYEGLEMTINAVTFSENDNKQEAIVDLTVINESGGEIPSNHLSDLNCKDGQGRYMDKALTIDMPEEYSWEKPLSTGEKRRGKEVFSVASDVDNLYCSFDFSEQVEGYKEIWKLK